MTSFLTKAPDLDVVSINRYYAWYSDTGRSELITLQMPTEVKSWYEKYKKPVLVSEYGAGTVAGMHQVYIIYKETSICFKYY